MDRKQKRKLIIVGAIELVVVVFCLTVSIWTIATIAPANDPDRVAHNWANGPFIGWFQNNSTPFFLIIVLPLFIILALDIIYLIVYATRRESAIGQRERDAIAEEARRQAREEVLREMQQELQQEQPQPEEQPQDNPSGDTPTV